MFVNSEPLKAQEDKTPARWRESEEERVEEEIEVEEEKEEEVVIILNRSTRKRCCGCFYRGCHLFDFYDS